MGDFHPSWFFIYTSHSPITPIFFSGGRIILFCPEIKNLEQ